ncbi:MULTISPECIES: C45 family autoproteolytic acyltransferase/hydolase [Salimicrobium]|uniref:Acyl-CoA--6-aminopenicillanic acid acyltransferase n=1 Tax=Salimicrobium humidisoli TaxID=2029857 RepID=A0ABX4HVN4_9BACI|nr:MULTISPECIES: C45 family peptidase [Salimicrobium]PBB06990.1 acyl-CoA--6-aminopenicillanic acid acyltransferase [Salimicrobium humidisoli]
MRQVYSDVYQFRGSHYDFGFRQGEWLRNSPILANRDKQWEGKRARHFIIDFDEIKSMFDRFSLGIWDEIRGLADALDLSMETAIQNFGGYYLEFGKSGCSIYTNEHVLVRNYDSDPVAYEGRYMLYQPTDGGYATIGPSMQITGRTDGMNEHGLSMGYNFINRVGSDTGFLCNMIGRMILENSRTIEEAIDLLKNIPHRRAFSYVLLDSSGRSVVVEASARDVKVREGNISTNHFHKLTEENRYRMDDSLGRYQAMEDAVPEDIYSSYQLLNNTDEQVFSYKYGAWAGTIHTAAYLPEKKQAWFTHGADRLPMLFNFEDWLNGEDTKARKVKGYIDSPHPFVNMEYQ